MTGRYQAGEALARALRARAGAPVTPEQGRELLLALVRLHELGALDFSPAAASPGDPAPGSLPRTAARSAAVGSGTRADRPGDLTAPAYNMGQSICIAEDE